MPCDQDDKPCKEEEAKQDGVLSKLMKSRTVLVTGTVDQELAEKVIAQLLVLDADSHDPIRVVVSSPGGPCRFRIRYLRHDAVRPVARYHHWRRLGGQYCRSYLLRGR